MTKAGPTLQRKPLVRAMGIPDPSHGFPVAKTETWWTRRIAPNTNTSLAAKSTPLSLGVSPMLEKNGRLHLSLILTAIPHFTQIVYQSCLPIFVLFKWDGGDDTKTRSTPKLEARPHRRAPHSVGSKESPKVNNRGTCTAASFTAASSGHNCSRSASTAGTGKLSSNPRSL